MQRFQDFLKNEMTNPDGELIDDMDFDDDDVESGSEASASSNDSDNIRNGPSEDFE